MGRPSYVCTVCSETFTRKYSARRHNNNLHDGAAEIARLIDYLAGRSSGQYMPNNPFWFKRNNHDFRSATVADTVGNTFEPTYLRQQAPLGISQYPHSAMYRSLPTIDEQRYGSGLSLDKIVKIDELRRLLYKHAQYFTNPYGTIKWAVYCSSNGDNKFLDEKLEQLRSIDSLARF